MKRAQVLAGPRAAAGGSVRSLVKVIRRPATVQSTRPCLGSPSINQYAQGWVPSNTIAVSSRLSQKQKVGSWQIHSTTQEVESASGDSDGDPVGSNQSVEVTLATMEEEEGTTIIVEVDTGRDLLANITTVFHTLGIVVLDGTVTRDRETGRSKQIFTVTEPSGDPIPESEFKKLKGLLLAACASSQDSGQPAIYGVVAAQEAKRLRSTPGSVMAQGQGALQGELLQDQKPSSSLEEAAARGEAAAALELAAAEMAQAAAALVQVERVASELATKLTADSEAEEEVWKQLEQQERQRVEASAVLERRMAAMEAALASRRQFKRQQKIKAEKASEEVPTSPEADIMKQLMAQGGATAVGTGPACGQGYEIFLQAFNWESWRSQVGWYNELATRLDEFKDAGYTAMWLPPPSTSVSEQGYLPTDLYNLNSKYGSEEDLKNLLRRMRERELKSVADIVINHRCASSQKDGKWNQFGGRLAWNESVITCNNPQWGGSGARSTGDEYEAAPNIDHTQEMVRKNLQSWMQWLRQHIGYDGWRFDFVKGYSGHFTREYIDATVPTLAFGEYWDACGYSDGVLDYNQNAHRQRTVDWCDSTGGTSGAFDFTTKGILQEAVAKGEYWRLVDAQGKPSGVLGIWPSRAVTFIDNHDTGSTLNHWPFPSDGLQQGYAYILTHPGTPAIFWDHWEDQTLREVITDLIKLRKKRKLHARSRLKILVARAEFYSAVIDDKVVMKIGPGDWSPNQHPETMMEDSRWEIACSGDNFAVWDRDTQ
eukprot:CAMPEP_0197854428 /NCGR_PEP_ID=MMETSP1438-20131217/24657_1 /TAXON_ID=1461541 /ORGANISM="Pterosperma sp., Strain CCMP1384" /LENGTH=767 /DNA_ID=CAMNT_0043469163 /DNA_START=187 /DNA_END=2490 /DNA_ORIENTATION=+